MLRLLMALEQASIYLLHPVIFLVQKAGDWRGKVADRLQGKGL